MLTAFLVFLAAVSVAYIKARWEKEKAATVAEIEGRAAVAVAEAQGWYNMQTALGVAQQQGEAQKEVARIQAGAQQRTKREP
ncbi:hypothetical protein Q3A66_19110 [Hymenobacter sp. BT770]|uniref:hypothetical protein n=1 Tax=Hymenobacter sp. BT770 TaxID=2886942 RepID=UPI001D112503|nr:hypothetical protein [Hymenobacter sp. BT770]MCC3155228.1 hypothetical protein [Hymenobacter sp. BT770]MDO3417183.1 hypothetical protein [Hymenobacter sp. BT770]